MQIFGVGLPELIILIIIAGFVVVPILIAILLNKRFKRSRENKPTNEQRRGAFSSPESAGRWARGLLVASLILAAIGVISGLLQVELLSRFARGADYTMEEVTRNDSRQGLIGIAQIVLGIGTAIAFLIWFHRVNKNISSLGNTGVIFTPGWAVGFFFVPFLNLVRPFQAMRAVWHGSDPSRPGLDLTSHGPGHGRLLGTPALVGWWWGLFLIFNFIGNAAGRLLMSEKTAAGLQSGSSLMVLSDLLEIPGALIAIRLVSHITKWQIEKKRVISQQAAEAPLVSLQ